jgi:hypothetical protein
MTLLKIPFLSGTSAGEGYQNAGPPNRCESGCGLCFMSIMLDCDDTNTRVYPKLSGPAA